MSSAPAQLDTPFPCPRRILHAWFALPWAVQMRIAGDLKLDEAGILSRLADPQPAPADQAIYLFRAASRANQLRALATAIDRARARAGVGIQ